MISHLTRSDHFWVLIFEYVCVLILWKRRAGAVEVPSLSPAEEVLDALDDAKANAKTETWRKNFDSSAPSLDL